MRVEGPSCGSEPPARCKFLLKISQNFSICPLLLRHSLYTMHGVRCQAPFFDNLSSGCLSTDPGCGCEALWITPTDVHRGLQSLWNAINSPYDRTLAHFNLSATCRVAVGGAINHDLNEACLDGRLHLNFLEGRRVVSGRPVGEAAEPLVT